MGGRRGKQVQADGSSLRSLLEGVGEERKRAPNWGKAKSVRAATGHPPLRISREVAGPTEVFHENSI